MKTSAVLASLLFGSFAVAAPVDRRALVYKTEVLTETVIVYTTVYDDDFVPEATTTPAGYFYEQPKAPSSAAAQPTTSSQAPAYTPPAAEEKPSSAYVAPAAQTPTPTPSPSPVVEEPKPVVETPQPAPSSAYVAPVAAASSAAPAAPVTPSKPTTGDSTTGEFSGDITIYQPAGNLGACGTSLQDTDMVVALSKDAWGASTYDVMTGAATNKWCGQKITAYYQGNKVEATIMDMCPGCSGMDIDLSPAAWKQLTGSDEMTRYKATWSKA